jgi:hypothetical protein
VTLEEGGGGRGEGGRCAKTVIIATVMEVPAMVRAKAHKQPPGQQCVFKNTYI